MATRTLISRSFEVPVGLDDAWTGLAQVRRWPEWAPHIRSVELAPDGPLGAGSTGTFRLRGAPRTDFQMTAWSPPRSWTWVGAAMGMTLTYRHDFEPAGPSATALTWVVDGEGRAPVLATLGRMFSGVYRRNPDRAVPRLIDWYRAEGG